MAVPKLLTAAVRRGRVHVINKQNPRLKARRG
jgi:ribosomal protein L36